MQPVPPTFPTLRAFAQSEGKGGGAPSLNPTDLGIAKQRAAYPQGIPEGWGGVGSPRIFRIGAITGASFGDSFYKGMVCHQPGYQSDCGG
jgi:hypothetical protein